MQDLVGLGIYELVTGHPPPPIDSLLAKVTSEHARRTYQRAVTEYLNWIERDPFVVDSIILGNYKAELLEYRPPAVVAVRLRAIREFYDEAVDAGLVAGNPAAKIAPPACTPDPSCQPPLRQAAERQLGNCNRALEAGRRDYALCLLAAETGVEPEAVCQMKVADFRREGDTGTVRRGPGHGDTPSEIELSERLTQALDDYLSGREVDDDSPLFGFPRSHVRAMNGQSGRSGGRGCSAKHGARRSPIHRALKGSGHATRLLWWPTSMRGFRAPVLCAPA